jgi:hypothetical protein
MGNDHSRVAFPSEFDLKTPVDSLVYHTLFDPDWVKYLPKVVNHGKEEDVSSSGEPEYEREQAPDDQELAEPNHDPCEDCEEFEFDKTGARVNESYRNPYRKFAEGVDVCVSDDCVCTPLPSSSSPSPSSVPSFSFSPSSPYIPPNLPGTLLIHLRGKLHLLRVLLLLQLFRSFLMFSVVVKWVLLMRT